MKNSLIALAMFVVAAPDSRAVEVIADFTYDLTGTGVSAPKTAGWDSQPNVFTNTQTSLAEYSINNGTKWTQVTASVPDPYTFTYDIAGLGIGAAAELRITVDTVSSTADLNPAAGNGIAVVGGSNNSWWDPADPGLSFSVVIEDAANNDITSNFKIDLTGVAMRWSAGATATFADQPIGYTSLLQGVTLTTGQIAETFFTATATGAGVATQVQQLRFAITTVADTTAPVIASTNPADNATAAPTGSDLTVAFNEDIALTGTGTVTIRDLGQGPDIVINLPDPQVSISGGRNLVINPSSDLPSTNSHAVQISATAVQDLASPPNAFAGIGSDTTWNFSTAIAPPVGPNVIVYLLDDVGLTDVEQHPIYFPDGSPLFETPNMHRLASQGMRFNHAYAQPLCSASRSCLLSGQDTAARNLLHLAITSASVSTPGLPVTTGPAWPYSYPTDRNHMPLEVETIAERLKAAGYVTWHAGKWHLSPATADPTYYPDRQGFDKQLGVGGAGPSSYFGPFTMPNMVDHNGNPAPGATGVHIAKHMQTLVQNMIDNHIATDPARPFFLYYPAYSVHGPHEAKKSLFDKYQAKLAGLPNSKHKHPVMAAQIEMADQELGSMMDYLDAKGLSNNTLFIFLSDNGGLSITYQSGTVVDDIGTDDIPDDNSGNVVNGTYAKTTPPVDPTTRMTNMDPRRAGKSSLFDGGLRVPMIIRYPNGGIPAATSTHESVELEDIYQTILDYTPAVARPGYTLDGVSLKPVLQQTGSLPERDIFIYFPRSNETWGTSFLAGPRDFTDPENHPAAIPYPGGTAMIHYPYKMIARYSTGHDAAAVNYQLYRTDLDEGETHNIAGKYPEVVDAMRKRLEAYYLHTNAVVPPRNPGYGGTYFNSLETTAKAFLAAAGLTPNTPGAFLLSDPDLDGRRNEDEFLRQTDPNGADASVATTWLSNNGSFEELRFALPANVVQSSFQILNANGTVAFTPSSGLTLDAQYGPYFVYKPTNPQPGGVPGNYRIALVQATPASSLTADADGDGLPDTYESSNGLNPGNPADGMADNDGDGLTRGQEYLAGTSDSNSNDRFRMWIDSQSGSTASLGFDLKDQKAYRLRKSGNLIDWTLWEDFGVIAGDHPVTLPVTTDQDREFFRIEAYQP